MTGTIDVEQTNSICTITLENEGKRNAITYEMMEELIETITSLEETDDNYVVVIRGAGEKAFSAGFDLSQDRDPDKEPLWQRVNNQIEGYEYPTIAMINGDTFGGAVELVASCDIRIAREGARFGITPAKIGIVYGPQAITRVINLVGAAKTKELLFTAEPIDAGHAHEIGLLNHLVTEEELESRTYDMAETIASNAPLSLKYMKQIISAIQANRELSETEIEWAMDLRQEAFDSRDHEEGVEAFSEGREPEFEGR